MVQHPPFKHHWLSINGLNSLVVDDLLMMINGLVVVFHWLNSMG